LYVKICDLNELSTSSTPRKEDQPKPQDEAEGKGKKQKKKEKGTKVTLKPRILIWLETPNNPRSTLYDIAEYSKIAKQIGASLVVDSTFATPVLQQPLLHGADYVLHSCTKGTSLHTTTLHTHTLSQL